MFDSITYTALAGEDVNRFDKALGMLDCSIRRLRSVAHNMMPESLSRNGLKSALSGFCDSVPAAELVWHGDSLRLNFRLEVMIYRFISELVNNALQHAAASHILVQVMQKYNLFAFTVKDNGCGFDTDMQSRGTGLSNIRSRVAACGGTFSLRSVKGHGTEVQVKLKIAG